MQGIDYRLLVKKAVVSAENITAYIPGLQMRGFTL
jgi:hypothetical protein